MVPLPPESVRLACDRFLALLDRWNRTHALTALPLEARFEELVLDSWVLVPFLDDVAPGSRIVDFGTGMGIPAVVLAVARPDLQVVALDKSRKKVAFVRQAALELGLGNLQPQLGKAEELPPLQASMGVAKAVGSLGLLMAWWQRHRLSGAPFLALKGEAWEEECSDLPSGWAVQPHPYELPTRGRRTVLVLQ